MMNLFQSLSNIFKGGVAIPYNKEGKMAKVKEYPTSSTNFKIKDLLEMYKNRTLTLNPEFQRSYIWERIPGKRTID